MLSTLLALATGFSQTLGIPQSARSPAVEEILARVREAVGWDRFRVSGMDLILRGQSTIQGTAVPLELRLAADGRFREHEGGPVGMTTGFDGSILWRGEPGGVVRRSDFGFRDRACVRSWFLGGFWLDPRAPVELAALPEPDPRAPALLARVRGSPVTVVLRFDPDTWLPISFGAAQPAVELSGHEQHLGLCVPRRVVFLGGGAPPVVWEIHEVEAVPAGERSPFARPPSGSGGARLEPGVPPEIEARRAAGDYLHLRALVEGVPAWVLFDSGTGYPTLLGRTAEALELESVGEHPTYAAGGMGTSTLRPGKSLRVGPLVLADPLYRVLDLPSRETFDGIIGSEILAHGVVELELAAGRFAFHPPGHDALPAGGRWQPLRFEGPIPCVEASFEGRTGWFRIDTGAMSAVVFHQPAVQRLRLLDGRHVHRGYSQGATNVFSELRGELAWFELGGRRFERVPAAFSETLEGAMADPYLTGTLGTALLSKFRIVFDCRNERIAFLSPG